VVVFGQAGVQVEGLVAAVEGAVDESATRSGCGIEQAMMSAVSSSALVPQAHLTFLTGAVAQTASTDLRH
jgi:hypothetical protein